MSGCRPQLCVSEWYLAVFRICSRRKYWHCIAVSLILTVVISLEWIGIQCKAKNQEAHFQTIVQIRAPFFGALDCKSMGLLTTAIWSRHSWEAGYQSYPFAEHSKYQNFHWPTAAETAISVAEIAFGAETRGGGSRACWSFWLNKKDQSVLVFWHES